MPDDLRILLVDDDPDFLASLTDLLKSREFAVEAVGSYEEAVATVADSCPDVALIDSRLGARRGIDLIVQLRRDYPELICIMATAYADAETTIEAFKSGANDFLRKPFESGELFAALHRCADRKRLLREKEMARQAREESERRFSVAFATSPDAIVLAYPGGAIVDVNPGFEQLTGYSRQSVIGLSSLDAGYWNDPSAREKFLKILAEKQRVDNFETDLLLADGRVRTGLVSARMVELDGEDICLFVVRDIHELKLKEVRLAESEERFRTLVDHLPGAVYRCLFDADYSMQFISAPISEIAGYSAEDIVDNRRISFGSLIHPDDREAVNRSIAESVSSQQPFSLEYRIVHADGTVRWLHDKGQAVFAENGALRYLDGVLLDVSQNKRFVEALAASERRLQTISQEYRTVLEGISDAILLVGLDMIVRWGNSGASKHFGISQDELEGIPCDLIWGKADSGCMGCLREVLQNGQPAETIQRSSNGKVWGVKVFPIKTEAGEVVSMVQIASDMTEKMRLRDQASRSAHLAALGELSAGVAHEINNPTGAILLDVPMLKDGFADLLALLQRYAPDLSAEKIAGLDFNRFCHETPLVIDEIYEGAQRIRRIVEELKDFSRPARGDLAIVDLNEVVRKAARLVHNALKQATDNFIEEYWLGPLLCNGSAQRLEQVLINLLLNACYALPERGRGIRLTTFFDAETKTVRVEVRDEGKGIDPAHMAQITDPFFTTRRDVGGTGLGLSVSSRIVDEHKGIMKFDSTLGEGTTVTLSLPCVEEGNRNAS